MTNQYLLYSLQRITHNSLCNCKYENKKEHCDNLAELYIDNNLVGTFVFGQLPVKFIPIDQINYQENNIDHIPLSIDICCEILGPDHMYVTEYLTNQTIKSMYKLFIYTIVFIGWKIGVC